MQKSLVKNAIYKIGLNFFNLILPVLIGAYVYQTLGPDSIGRVKVGETIFNYFFIFASFGVYQYGIREVSRVKNDKKKVAQLFTSLIMFTLITNILSLAAFLAVSFFGYGHQALFPVLMVYAINFVLNVFYVEWVNEAYEDYGFISIKTMIVKLIYVALLFMFIKSSHDYIKFVALLVISTGLNNIISYIYVRRRVKFDFSDVRFRPHLKPLFLVVIFSNGNVLYTQLDRFMLGQFVNEKSVSYYTMAQQIATMISALMLSIVQVTIPRLSFLLGGENEEQYLTLLGRIAKIYSALLFPAAIGLYVVSNTAVVLYGKSQFINAGPALAIFSLYMITIGIESILSNQVIYIKKRESVLVRLIFICGFINLILNFVCLKLGVLDARTSILNTLIANLSLITLEYIYIRKFLKVKFHLLSWTNLKYLVYSLTFIPIAMLIDHYVKGTLKSFLAVVVACAFIYAALLLVTKDDIIALLAGKLKGRLVKRS